MNEFEFSAYRPESGEGNTYFSSVIEDGRNIEDLMIELSRDFAKSDYFYQDSIVAHKDQRGRSFFEFFEVRNELDSDEAETSFNVLVGGRGHGKSSFIRWWKRTEAEKSCFILDVEILRDIQHVGDQRIDSFIVDFFCSCIRDFYQNLTDAEQLSFLQIFSSFVSGSEVLPGCRSFDMNFLTKNSASEGNHILLVFLISTMNEYLGKPLWIVIDNLDLENEKIRSSYMLRAKRLSSKLSHEGDRFGYKCSYHFLISVRPSTLKTLDGVEPSSNILFYPNCDTQNIFLKKLQNSLVRILENNSVSR